MFVSRFAFVQRSFFFLPREYFYSYGMWKKKHLLYLHSMGKSQIVIVGRITVSSHNTGWGYPIELPLCRQYYAFISI